MKIQISINGKSQTKEIPISWDQVTYQQFLDIMLCNNDYVQVLALLLSIDIATLRKAKINGLDSVLMSLGFIHTKPIATIPKTILGYEIPKDLGFETIAQFDDLRTELNNSKNLTVDQHLHKYPLYCATYACKPYDWRKAEEMASQFFNAPCQEVLGIGNFTLAKLIGLKRSTGQNFQKRHILKKRFRQVLIGLQARLVFIRHYFTWKKKPAIKEANY